MKLENYLIVIDSCDCCGKTNLSKHLIEKFRFNYMHQGLNIDMYNYFTDRLYFAFNEIQKNHESWVFDRLHLSEEIYGNIFRKVSEINSIHYNNWIIKECKERQIKYLLIFCIPPKDKVLKIHSERNKNKEEMYDNIEKIYDIYEKIYNDNLIDEKYDFIYKYDYTKDQDYKMMDSFLDKKD